MPPLQYYLGVSKQTNNHQFIALFSVHPEGIP